MGKPNKQRGSSETIIQPRSPANLSSGLKINKQSIGDVNNVNRAHLWG